MLYLHRKLCLCDSIYIWISDVILRLLDNSCLKPGYSVSLGVNYVLCDVTFKSFVHFIVCHVFGPSIIKPLFILCFQQISVLRLLHSVHQVTKDYQNLRQEILEVQQLQKQLSDSLRAQLTQVHGHFNLLRNKIVGHKSPQLK